MSVPAADRPDLHYDRVTRAWRLLLGEELHYGLFESPTDSLDVATRRLTERMAELAAVDRTHHLLDVGCGIGTPACWVAEHVGARVTGISTSEVGLAFATERATQRGLADRVEFLKRDGMASEFPAASFDRAWVLEASHLMSAKDVLIQECARVLRPQGRLVLCDIVVHRDLLLPEVLRHARAFRLLNAVFGRAKMETLDTYRRHLESAGLSVTHCEDVSEATAPTFDRWHDNAVQHQAAVVELIGDQAWREFADSCGVLRDLWRQQILGYGLIAAIHA